MAQDRQNVKHRVIVAAMRTAIGALVCIVAALASSAHAQTPSVEEQLVALINTARSHAVVMHAGLRAAARQHSAEMASAGAITHSGSRSRIYNAAPDPPERSGPPDHGFTQSWCEVAGWEPGGTEAGTARRFFDDWIQSSQDNACMTSTDMTVVGVGVYQTTGRWWATLEMVQDRTPPVAGAAAPQTPAPKSPAAPTSAIPAPVASRAPANAQRSTSSSAEQSSSSFGLREILVALAGFCFVPLLYTIRRRNARRRAAGV